MKIRSLSILIIAFSISSFCFSQQFLAVNNLSNSNYLNGESFWADFDNDGDYDLITIGSPENISTTSLFSNQGDSTFIEIMDHPLIGVASGSIAIEDYNLDGLLDIAISGSDGMNFSTHLYKNLGDFEFSKVQADFVNVYFSIIDWGDIDNDGKPDLLISGRTEWSPPEFDLKIYKNLGNDNFEAVETDIEIFIDGEAKWIDLDNDLDLDLTISGATPSSSLPSLTRLYLNDGNYNFRHLQDLAVHGSGNNSSIDWGDYNKDGFYDLLVSGIDFDNTLSVYGNNNGNSFIKLQLDLIGGGSGDAHWIDFDNDGDIDIISSLHTVTEDTAFANSYLYRNHEFKFEPVVDTSLPQDFSTISLTDINLDGNLDLFYPNKFYSDIEPTTIFLNTVSSSNPPPNSSPILNEPITKSDTTVFSWERVSGFESDYTYNFYLRTNSDTIVSANSLPSGFRKKLDHGNAHLNNQFMIVGLEPQTYFWSVQAVSNSYRGGSFSTEKTYDLILDTAVNNKKDISIYPNPFNENLYVDSKRELLTIQIFSTNGILILEKMILNRREKLDLQSLKAGIYLLRVTSQYGQSQSFKIIKEITKRH